jgi:hypothetical protein
MKDFKAKDLVVGHDSTHCIGTRLFPEQMPRALRGNGKGAHTVKAAGESSTGGRGRNGTTNRIVK